MSKTYYIAHIEGAERDVLERKGFIICKESMGEYALLEKGLNDALVGRSEALRVAFVNTEGSLAELTEEQVKDLLVIDDDVLTDGDLVIVVGGLYVRLDGIVRSVRNKEADCSILVYQRYIEVTIDLKDLKLKEISEVKNGKVLIN